MKLTPETEFSGISLKDWGLILILTLISAPIGAYIGNGWRHQEVVERQAKYSNCVSHALSLGSSRSKADIEGVCREIYPEIKDK